MSYKLLIFILTLCTSVPAYAAYNVWLDNSLTKYRQGGEDGTSGNASLSISLAKNEIESFQVMIYADGETLTNVDVSVSNLTKGSDTIDNIYLYKQHYLDMTSVNVLGVLGDWEDMGSNVWRKNIGTVPRVWSGTPGSYHDQDVGFITGATYSDGNNEAFLTAAKYWKYDGTYLSVYSAGNPTTVYAEIQAPNRKSRVEYQSGWYPDALLPKVDRYFGETRNTFPFTVATGKVQGVWVDIGTTSTSPAGTYTGTVTISAQGKSDVTRDISVTVYDFALPTTSTFNSQFVFGQALATFAHGLGYAAASPPSSDTIALLKVYMKSFLYHKMNPVLSHGVPGYGSTYLTWNDTTNTLSIPTWEPWYSIVKDVYDGTAITAGPYANAEMNMKRIPYHWPTESDANIPVEDKETAMRQYVQLVWDKFTSEGWDPWNHLIMAAYYDEPKCETTTTWRGATWNKCDAIIDQLQDLASINTGGLGIFKRNYVNTKLIAGLEAVETYGFHSTNNYSYVCPGWDRDCTGGGTSVPRSSYSADNVFGYLACDNNSCWVTGNSWYSGQIDWSADAPALYNRFPGLIWAKYELTGTVYWQTNYQDYVESNVNGAGKPYESIWNFGSNGDGHLVYPGVASATGRTLPASTPIIGGTHDIPIESIRMKHIRDAIEDWEYVQMAKVKSVSSANAVLDTAFIDADINDAYWNLNMTPANFLSVRSSLAAQVMTGHGIRWRARLAGNP